MGLYANLTFPKDKATIDKWLKDNKDAVITELKEHYKGCLEHCGENDGYNTVPAKELYEKALVDVFSCKDEIQAFYEEVEYWENHIEKEWTGFDKNRQDRR